MTGPYFASSSPPTGTLLQKAAALLLALGLSTSAGYAGTPGVATWSSDAAALGDSATICASTNYTTLASLDAEKDLAQGLARALEELGIARRLLGAIAAQQQPFTLDYLSRLDEIFEFAEQNQDKLGEVAGMLASHLQGARVDLLDGSPTVKEWTLLARAIDPDATLKVPRRFIRPPVEHGHGIDVAAFDAGAWTRSLVS